jgi:hypothetical protein
MSRRRNEGKHPCAGIIAKQPTDRYPAVIVSALIRAISCGIRSRVEDICFVFTGSEEIILSDVPISKG